MNKHLLPLAAAVMFCSASFAQVFTVYSTSNSGLSSNNCISIGFSQGTVWSVSTSPGNGASAYNGVTWNSYTTSNSSIASNETYDVAFDSQNNVWIATDMGLVKFDGANWTTFNTSNSGIPTNAITSVYAGAGDTLWLGTLIGLVKFHGSTFTSYTTLNSGIADNTISNINGDNNGNIWLCHYSAGISVFNHSGWTVYNTTNTPLTVTDIRGVDFDSNSNAWVATFGNGLAKFDGMNWTFFTPLNSPILSDQLTSVFVDSGDRKYAGCGGGSPGLSVYDNGAWDNFSYSTSNIPYGGIMGVVEGAGNDRWIATFGGGLAKMDVTVLGIVNAEKSAELRVYPNPASDIINLVPSHDNGKAKSVSVIDVTGKVVLNEKNFGDAPCSISVSSLPRGVYIVEIHSADKTIRTRFVKQ